jgi:hypothetical protein
MQQYIPFVIVTIVSFLLATFFILRGVKQKSVNFIIIAVLCLAISIGSIVWMGVLAYRSFSNKVKKEMNEHLKPRTGREAYVALFGEPVDSCLKVLNLKDQIVPRLDCCIWLEFETCPSELKRVLAQKTYATKSITSFDQSKYASNQSQAPAWWKPDVLGRNFTECLHENETAPGAYQVLFFAKDSSHAFYCDLAD